MYFCEKISTPSWGSDCGLVASHELRRGFVRTGYRKQVRCRCSLKATCCWNREAGRQTTDVATLHTIFGADASGVVTESGIELHQFIRRVFLILGRKVFTISAYFPATHLERLWIAHITRVQDV